MKLFISYASEQYDFADRLAIALTNEGHDVFFDADDLRAGENYNERLRTAVDDCDRFIYLVSPESIEAGSYARSELQMAKSRFKIAVGRIVPVMAVPTDYSKIPNYAKSVTVLEPEGDPVVAVLNRVAEIEKGGIHVVGLKNVIGGAMLVAAFAIGLYQAMLWALPRLATTALIAAVTSAGLVLLALCWILWRRCVLRGTSKSLAVPAAVLGIFLAGVWAASVFTPRVVWLLPGTTWAPLMASAETHHSLLLANISSEFDNIETSGVFLVSNKQAAELIIARSSDDLHAVLTAYLTERGVPEQFHEAYLSGWTAKVRLEDQFGNTFAKADNWTASVRIDAEGEKTAVLNWRPSSSISIAFVELN